MRPDPLKEKQILDAAAAVFLSPDYDFFSNVHYKAIANRAGWSEKVVRECLSKPELRRRLIDHLTAPEAAAEQVDPEFIAAAFNDRTASFYEVCLELGKWYMEMNRENPLFRASMALWPYAAHEGRTDGSESIRQRLAEVYRTYDQRIEYALNSWLVGHSDVIKPRLDFMSVGEVAQVAVAITEGIAMRNALDPEGTSVDLAGRAYAVVLAAFIEFEGEEVESGPARLAEFERRRRGALAETD